MSGTFPPPWWGLARSTPVNQEEPSLDTNAYHWAERQLNTPLGEEGWDQVAQELGLELQRGIGVDGTPYESYFHVKSGKALSSQDVRNLADLLGIPIYTNEQFDALKQADPFFAGAMDTDKVEFDDAGGVMRSERFAEQMGLGRSPHTRVTQNTTYGDPVLLGTHFGYNYGREHDPRTEYGPQSYGKNYLLVPSQGQGVTPDGTMATPDQILAHEIGHVYREFIDQYDHVIDMEPYRSQFIELARWSHPLGTAFHEMDPSEIDNEELAAEAFRAITQLEGGRDYAAEHTPEVFRMWEEFLRGRKDLTISQLDTATTEIG